MVKQLVPQNRTLKVVPRVQRGDGHPPIELAIAQNRLHGVGIGHRTLFGNGSRGVSRTMPLNIGWSEQITGDLVANAS